MPVEFLVNHRTILWDDHAQEVSIYHIELDTHDVLLANGAPAESYRDDGNRWLFQNANTGWGLPPQKPCAPVLTGGPLVNAIWQRLLDRAGPRPNRPLTEDADLHMLADGRAAGCGRTVPRDIHVFRLTTAPASLRLVSRAVPAGTGPGPRSAAARCGAASPRGAQGHQIPRDRSADSRLDEGFHAFEAEHELALDRWRRGDPGLAMGRVCRAVRTAGQPRRADPVPGGRVRAGGGIAARNRWIGQSHLARIRDLAIGGGSVA